MTTSTYEFITAEGDLHVWEPSKRAQEAIKAMWAAFYDGDRWLRAQHQSTARMLVKTLVGHGLADVDPDAPYEGKDAVEGFTAWRFRLSEAELNANGMTRATRFFAGATLTEIVDIQDAIEQDDPNARVAACYSTWEGAQA